MLNKEILELRKKLDESVINKKNSKKTYKLSVELDELIAKYYKKTLKTDNKKEKK